MGALVRATLILWSVFFHGDYANASEGRRCEPYPPPPAGGYDPGHLVVTSKVIVRARADSSGHSSEALYLNIHETVQFTVLEVIDSGGTAVPVRITVAGWLSDSADFSQDKVPYHWTRRDGLGGSCWAFDYQRGGEFLLLLNVSTAGALTPYWAPLQPTNMQIRGAKDPWVEWVRVARRGR